MIEERTRLFRTVNPVELASLEQLRRFINLKELQVKYFALSEAHAWQFGRQAAAFFDDGPYTLVETALRTSLIRWDFRVEVDRGIVCVVVPTPLLRSLEPPIIRLSPDEGA